MVLEWLLEHSPLLVVLWFAVVAILLVARRQSAGPSIPRWLWVPIGLLCIALIAPVLLACAVSGSLPPIRYRSFDDVRRWDEMISAFFWVQPLLVAVIVIGAKGYRWVAVMTGGAELAVAWLLCAFSVFYLNPP